MELTFVTDLGQSFVVEIDPNMELENVMALLEAESDIPVHEQSISYEGRELSNPKATMTQLGVGDSAMLLLRRKVNVAGMYVPPMHHCDPSAHMSAQDTGAGRRNDAVTATR
ncbi:hypothetical protein C8Q72DRAFT_67802 [Fomitopsis betulina]|nr:hypothetical protein C8Q72DRAFT_67802 [Fomitopsis betulina]